MASEYGQHALPLPVNTSENSLKSSSKNKDKIIVEDAGVPSPNPFQFFEKNGFRTLSSYLAEKIEALCNNQNDELVIAAMKLAL
ncbi:hypothetical protein ACOI1C_06510 [Bacillus sp. DJP31]|uniref:hypothetical protein n=1 Tax=Bacillus sp. DJP31 TaxID=3409789 RepID=UPI003BB51E5E